MEPQTKKIVIGIIIVLAISTVIYFWKIKKYDCEVKWSNWGECDKATGTQSRTSTVVSQASNGGKECPASPEKQNCAVNCVLGDWSSCSMDGKKSKPVVVQAKNGGQACPPTDGNCLVYQVLDNKTDYAENTVVNGVVPNLPSAYAWSQKNDWFKVKCDSGALTSLEYGRNVGGDGKEFMKYKCTKMPLNVNDCVNKNTDGYGTLEEALLKNDMDCGDRVITSVSSEVYQADPNNPDVKRVRINYKCCKPNVRLQEFDKNNGFQEYGGPAYFDRNYINCNLNKEQKPVVNSAISGVKGEFTKDGLRYKYTCKNTYNNTPDLA